TARPYASTIQKVSDAVPSNESAVAEPRLNLPASRPVATTVFNPPGIIVNITATQTIGPSSNTALCATPIQTTASMPPKIEYTIMIAPVSTMIVSIFHCVRGETASASR